MVGTEILYHQLGGEHTKTLPTEVKLNLSKTGSLQAGLPEELHPARLQKKLARAECPRQSVLAE